MTLLALQSVAPEVGGNPERRAPAEDTFTEMSDSHDSMTDCTLTVLQVDRAIAVPARQVKAAPQCLDGLQFFR
jgi:hypothetical protein